MGRWAEAFNGASCQRRNQKLFLVICSCSLIKRWSLCTSQFGRRQMISSGVENGETESYFQAWLACVLINPWRTPLWLNWVKFGLQVCSVLQSTLVDIIRNIPLAHKEPFLTHSHPSVAKSRRHASRSEKAVHGELWITPSNEFSLHRHEDSEIQCY